jgi:DNA polymerase-3 subunit epsilon
MNLVNTLVVLDLEATGTWIAKDKIIELAMIKITPDGHREVFNQKINPGIPVPPVIVKLTGIKDSDVHDAPAFKDAASAIISFIGKSDLAGFNIERFDLPLLEREMTEAGLKFEWQNLKIYDAQKVYHLNQKRDLSAAYEFYCHKNLDNAHSALADTEATLEILQAQVGQYGDHGNLSSLAKFNYDNPVEFYDMERRFRWWNGKLYMMFGKYAKQHSLQDLVKKDKGYLEWILSADFSQEVKDLIQSALSGQFPAPDSTSASSNSVGSK